MAVSAGRRRSRWDVRGRSDAWVAELFSAPALERLEEKRPHELVSVPYFDGLMAGEPDALVESFAGEPQLHH